VNPGGIIIAGLGVLLACQVFGGNLLGRLNIVKG